MQAIFWWQKGVEAGIYANYISICVVQSIVEDAKSRNVPGSQN